MSKEIARRSLLGTICQRCQRHSISPRLPKRPFSTTNSIAAPNDDQPSSSPPSSRPERASSTSDLIRLLGKPTEGKPTEPSRRNRHDTQIAPNLSSLANIMASQKRDQRASLASGSARGEYNASLLSQTRKSPRTSTLLDYDNSAENPDNLRLTPDMTPPHHLHIYSTKHNTHLTLTRPDRNPIISVSAGNINFRKAARGTFDAAYQLAAWTMKTMQERGLMAEIMQLEIILRGFGPGREAVTKALLGTEGRNLRRSVVRVTDATRLKFGGTRSPKPRRLG
ncbi:MAG: hypothetical protein M1812_005371 [Candelaria pacifica]|nr:MAG: hypothetical protein M1812_005371 [Candelaria pacifica]